MWRRAVQFRPSMTMRVSSASMTPKAERRSNDDSEGSTSVISSARRPTAANECRKARERFAPGNVLTCSAMAPISVWSAAGSMRGTSPRPSTASL